MPASRDLDFARVFEATNRARLLLGLDAEILAVTDGFCSACGLTRADVLGRSVFELSHYADNPALRERLRSHLHDVVRLNMRLPLAIDTATPTKVGVVWTEALSIPVLDLAGRAEYVVHLLRTAAREGTHNESQRERRLQKLIAHSYDGVALFGPIGERLFVSPSVTRTLGYTQAEFLEHFDILHPQDLEPFRAAFRSIVEGSKDGVEMRVRLRHKCGDWRVFELGCWNLLHDPDVEAIVAHFHDVTDHIALQHHLQRTNEQLGLALRAGRAMTWTAEADADGRRVFQWLSGDYRSFFGIESNEDKPNTPLTLVHPDDRAAVSAAFLASLNSAGELSTEFRGLPHEGRPQRYYACHARSMRVGDEERARVFGVTWDVSEQQRILQERAEFDRHLQETQKLESLGVLAGGIAHDFNNLLTTVLGNVSLMQRQLDPGSVVSQQLRDVETAARTATALCLQMLAYAGRAKVALASVSLNALVEETSLLQASLEKKVQLRFELAQALPRVIADPTQLRQVLMNLVINAAEAIGARTGTVTISTGRIPGDSALVEGALIVPDELTDQYVYLSVVDDGPGMDETTLDRIFEPFYTTKFTGRGLGLSAVLGIVRAHRGVLKAQSAPDEGARFLMALPLHEEAFSISSKPVALQPIAALTILVVDDDEQVLAVTRAMLDVLGMRVICARNGAEALKLGVQHAATLDAVIMDLTMPDMDGAETARALLAQGVTAPVLLVSGYGEQEARKRVNALSRSQVRYGFLHKPFDLDELQQRLGSLVRLETARH